jgi:hypothetical protein
MSSSISLLALYLLFGLVASLLLRRRVPEDWEEGLLASVLGPPLFALIVTAAVGNFVLQRLVPRSRSGRKS